jgi:hypothetical protein
LLAGLPLLWPAIAFPAGATALDVWEFDVTEDQVKNSGVGDGSTDSTATGHGRVTYDSDADRLTYEFSWENLEGPLTKVHVHGPAGPEESNPNHLWEILNSPFDLPEEQWTTGSFSRSFEDFLTSTCCTTPPPQALEAMFAGEAYVNVHTTLWPAGEIRGNFVIIPEPSSFGLVTMGLGALALGRRETRHRKGSSRGRPWKRLRSQRPLAE